MQLYKRNIKKSSDYKKLSKKLPSTLLMSKQKEGGYFENYVRYVEQYPFIRFNDDKRIDTLIIDIDSSQDGSEWLDLDVPHPSWIVWTDRGYQVGWILKKPIFISEQNKYRDRDFTYAMDVLKKLVHTFGADKDAIGFERVFRNPIYSKARAICRLDLEYDLGDFRHLESPAKLLDLKMENLTIAELMEMGYSDMTVGDGRNCALFDRLRLDAYQMMDNGRYSIDAVERRAVTYNLEFAEPMADKEVQDTVKSIDKFMMEKYDKGSFYMKNTTPEERKIIASKNGKKGGAVTAKVRSADAKARIYATLKQMESFDIKITISAVSRRAKSSKSTVTAYFKENNINGYALAL